MWQSEKAESPTLVALTPVSIARTRRHPQNGDMKSSKPIQIFKPGKRTAMSGVTLDFSDADLQATAAAYDPAKHEAPLVVGHPKHDDPAYGWAASLAYADGALEAMPSQVNADFADMVDAGAFKKVSASFYLPDAPNNPVPGVFYLRHIGFLGAQAPAVKGLRNPEFADAEEGVVEFAEWDDVDNASLWRSLRDWIIGKFGQEEADKVVPGYTVKNLEQSAQDELKESLNEESTAGAPAASFSEKGVTVTLEEKAALEAENAQMKQQLADSAARDKSTKAAAKHAEHAAFAEALVQEGKLLPVSKDVTVATMDFMAAQDVTVEFGEGDAKKPLLDAYKASLQASPKLVEFGEVSGAGSDASGTVNFAAPSGYDVDADRLALHGKVLAYQTANKTTYEAALAAVSA
jgi:hypothetical protein